MIDYEGCLSDKEDDYFIIDGKEYPYELGKELIDHYVAEESKKFNEDFDRLFKGTY